MARLADLRSRAVLRTADELGIPHAHAVGLRELLYAAAFQQADATIGDERDVELTAGWEGERGRFVAAARAAGMIVEAEPGLFVLPDLDEVAPAWVKKRATRAAARRDAGTTLSDVRAEAGKRGVAARESKRDASGIRLHPTRKQTDALPSLPPSLPPSTLRTEVPSDSSEKAVSPGPDVEPASTKRGTVGADFETFWTHYPRREAKGDARAAWTKLSAADRAAALAAVAEYGRAWSGATKEQRPFIPLPARWLRGERWTDDPGAWYAAAEAHESHGGRGLRPGITPPSFRNEGETGASKLDCLPVEEVGEDPPDLPPPPDGGGVWPRVLERLRESVDERDFDTWLRGTRQSGEVNGTLRVVVASDLFRQYVPCEYGEAIRQACAAEGVEAPLDFLVAGRE